LTPGDVVDYDRVRGDILKLTTLYNIREIAIDRWNSTQLQTQLSGDGMNVVQFGQGYASMAAPSKEFERLVASGAIKHDGDPVTRWMVSNCCIEKDAAGNIKPSKRRSSEKIDGIVAAVMAIGRAILHTEGSVYDSRGPVVL
jgi:phage terminase large subunit-like protein